jgi:hypothetical protein
MTVSRPTRALAALAAAALAIPAGARGQDTPVGERPYRFTVEGYAAQGRFADEAVPGDRRNLGGFGGRILFNRSTPASTLRGLFGRSSVGAFATYTAEQGSVRAATLHYGVQADFALFSRPVFRGVLDPFVSVGAGALRTSYEQVNLRGNVVDHNFAVTPAAGTRLRLLRSFGLRGDLRLPVVFGGSTSVNPVAEGGVYLSF